MLKPSHDLVDHAAGILLPFSGEMEIDHGCFQPGVTEILLDGADIDSGLQEMCCIGVAQGMDRDFFFVDACLELGFSESTLYGINGPGSGRSWSLVIASSQGGKEQFFITVRLPVLS